MGQPGDVHILIPHTDRTLRTIRRSIGALNATPFAGFAPLWGMIAGVEGTLGKPLRVTIIRSNGRAFVGCSFRSQVYPEELMPGYYAQVWPVADFHDLFPCHVVLRGDAAV